MFIKQPKSVFEFKMESEAKMNAEIGQTSYPMVLIRPLPVDPQTLDFMTFVAILHPYYAYTSAQ